MRRVKFGPGFEVDIVGNWGRIWNLVLDGGRERRKMVERERRIKRRSGSMFFEVAIDATATVYKILRTSYITNHNQQNY